MRAFVIAMECEAEAVRPALRGDDRLYVSGIGKVNAAAATQLAICEGAGEIWNAGLCGGFGDVEVGGVYGVERAVEYDFDLAKLNGTAVGVLDEMQTPYLPLRKVDGAARVLARVGGFPHAQRLGGNCVRAPVHVASGRHKGSAWHRRRGGGNLFLAQCKENRRNAD